MVDQVKGLSALKDTEANTKELGHGRHNSMAELRELVRGFGWPVPEEAGRQRRGGSRLVVSIQPGPPGIPSPPYLRGKVRMGA